MSVTFEVFRGSTEGRITADKTTRVLQPNEVFIEMTHAGLCGSDEVFLNTGQVLGHEGIGAVQQIGRDVQDVKIGDRVGFGFTHFACGNCRWCSNGLFPDGYIMAMLMMVLSIQGWISIVRRASDTARTIWILERLQRDSSWMPVCDSHSRWL